MRKIEIRDFVGIEELLEEMGFQYSPAGYYVLEIEDSDDEGIISNLNYAEIKYHQEYIVENKDSYVPLLRVHISPQLRRGRRVLEERLMEEGFMYNGFSWIHKSWLIYYSDSCDEERVKVGCEDEFKLGIRQGIKKLKNDVIKITHHMKVIKKSKYEVEVVVF